jgi:hypothetical protein
MMDAELEGLIISGPRHGKQFTYGLLEERAPSARTMPPVFTRTEALAEMTKRYFTGHGPAQAADFAWWSGLTLTEVKQGIESVKSDLDKIEIEGKPYWMGRAARSNQVAELVEAPANKPVARKGAAPVVHLLPNYDEYFIAYKDRSAIGERLRERKEKGREGLFFRHLLFIDGQVAGGWNTLAAKKNEPLSIEPVGKLSAAEKRGLDEEVKRYGKFAGIGSGPRLKN